MPKKSKLSKSDRVGQSSKANLEASSEVEENSEDSETESLPLAKVAAKRANIRQIELIKFLNPNFYIFFLNKFYKRPFFQLMNCKSFNLINQMYN